MKGARGLLISITGGKDLTLYEVDEAATRIRGEVDADANIIVGATFDEGLEGIIRCSVVATGIDSAGVAQKPTPAETRAAEITNKLRSEARRASERTREPVPAVAREHAPAARIEDAAHAAVAAAILPAAAIEDVAIRPMPAIKPSLFEQPSEPARRPRRLCRGRSSRRPRNVDRFARHACRASMSCRSRRRMKSGPAVASSMTSIRKSAACR